MKYFFAITAQSPEATKDEADVPYVSGGSVQPQKYHVILPEDTPALRACAHLPRETLKGPVMK